MNGSFPRVAFGWFSWFTWLRLLGVTIASSQRLAACVPSEMATAGAPAIEGRRVAANSWLSLPARINTMGSLVSVILIHNDLQRWQARFWGAMDRAGVQARGQRICAGPNGLADRHAVPINVGWLTGGGHSQAWTTLRTIPPRDDEKRRFGFSPAGLLVAGGLGLRKPPGQRRKRLSARDQDVELSLERERIAQDLHDTLGAGLTRVVLLCRSLDPCPANSAVRETLEKIALEASHLLNQMRDLIDGIQTRSSTVADFLAALREHAALFLAESGLTVRFDFPAPLPRLILDGHTCYQAMLVAKEALVNIVRHAQATEARLACRLIGSSSNGGRSQIEFSIADNGCGLPPGFPIAASASTAWKNSGASRGLPGMRARIHELGGEFELHSRIGKGTVVVFRLPLNSNQPVTARRRHRS